MDPERTPFPPQRPAPNPRRLYLFEPGWGIGMKAGSERVFCYMMAPGQDFYHRLLDGELYLYRGDERLCLACAGRRGLLSDEPRGLREPVLPFDFDGSGDFDTPPDDSGSGFELRYAPGDEDD